MTAGELPILLDQPRNRKGKRGKRVDPNGYKIVSVRLREAEFMSFAEHARSLGLTNSMALRIAARRIAGFLEIDEDTRHQLQGISSNIGYIGRSLSDMRAVAERDSSIDMKTLNEHRIAFGREFVRLDSLLQRLLNVSRRRQDGRMILEEAIRQ